MKLLLSALSIAILSLIPAIHKNLNNYLMGFFRDISRVKARNRRMNGKGIISIKDVRNIILDNEQQDPLQDVVDHILNTNITEEEKIQDLPIYTREELFELGNGENESGTILLSIFGRVYDVSQGKKYYGKDGKYHLFAGRDSTRALATGCLKESCLGSKVSSPDAGNYGIELNEKTTKEAKKWLSFFETHDKYSMVGYLADGDSLEELIDSLLEEETASLCKKNEQDNEERDGNLEETADLIAEDEEEVYGTAGWGAGASYSITVNGAVLAQGNPETFNGGALSDFFTILEPLPPAPPAPEPKPCDGVTCGAGKCALSETDSTKPTCICENTFELSIDGNGKPLCKCPDEKPYDAQANRCLAPPTIAPTSSPTKTPTAAPTVAPTSSPTFSPIEQTVSCADDANAIFSLDRVDKEVGCEWLTKNWQKKSIRIERYCGRENVDSKCPATCGLC